MENGKRTPKPLLLVVNPKSGKGMVRYRLYDIISLLSYKGFEVTVYPTKRKGTTQYVAKNIRKYERVVCCGGDGTLSEVLAGAAYDGGRVPVGFIPMGSTNDLSRNMHIPSNTVIATLIAAGNGRMEYDIGTLNNKPFSYIAAVGAFTDVAYSTPQNQKNALGHFAYVLEGAKTVSSIKPIKMSIDWDGNHIAGDFLFASVSNTYSVAGLVILDNKTVKFNDGVFELLLVKEPQNHVDAIELISDVTSHRMQGENVFICAARDIRFHFEEPVVFTLDGEKSDPNTDFTVHNYKRKVKLIVPSGIKEQTNSDTKFET